MPTPHALAAAFRDRVLATPPVAELPGPCGALVRCFAVPEPLPCRKPLFGRLMRPEFLYLQARSGLHRLLDLREALHRVATQAAAAAAAEDADGLWGLREDVERFVKQQGLFELAAEHPKELLDEVRIALFFQPALEALPGLFSRLPAASRLRLLVLRHTAGERQKGDLAVLQKLVEREAKGFRWGNVVAHELLGYGYFYNGAEPPCGFVDPVREECEAESEAAEAEWNEEREAKAEAEAKEEEEAAVPHPLFAVGYGRGYSGVPEPYSFPLAPAEEEEEEGEGEAEPTLETTTTTPFIEGLQEEQTAEPQSPQPPVAADGAVRPLSGSGSGGTSREGAMPTVVPAREGIAQQGGDGDGDDCVVVPVPGLALAAKRPPSSARAVLAVALPAATGAPTAPPPPAAAGAGGKRTEKTGCQKARKEAEVEAGGEGNTARPPPPPALHRRRRAAGSK